MRIVKGVMSFIRPPISTLILSAFLLEIHRVFLLEYLCFVVVTTIIFHSAGVEIIQDSKALHRLCGQRGAYDSKRANKRPLILFSGNFYWFTSPNSMDLKHLECK